MSSRRNTIKGLARLFKDKTTSWLIHPWCVRTQFVSCSGQWIWVYWARARHKRSLRKISMSSCSHPSLLRIKVSSTMIYTSSSVEKQEKTESYRSLRVSKKPKSNLRQVVSTSTRWWTKRRTDLPSSFSQRKTLTNETVLSWSTSQNHDLKY